MTAVPASHLDRAVRLFEFLAQVQQSAISTPRTYDRYWQLAWAHGMPRHRAVHFAHWDGTPEPGDEIGHIDRIDRMLPPEPNEVLTLWLTGELDDPDVVPELLTEIPDLDGEEGPDEKELLEDHPEVTSAYNAWLPKWTAWAERERIERPVRDAYGLFFEMHAQADLNPEELELVLAVGCLAWTPEGHAPVRRHLITTPVSIDLDPISGSLRITAVEAPDPVRLELDMLDSHLTNSRHITAVREEARDYDAHPLDRAAVGELLQRVSHSLDPDAVYEDAEQPARGTPTTAVVALAPAIVLRNRDRFGLVRLLERIRQQLIDTGVVPNGVLPLVDPDYRPPVETDPTPGALVTVDDDIYLPLPVNEKQLEVLKRVGRNAQTLVQGPPGTGKTHTAAALLSHLLAQGKRVLVTAQTDRALKEVRAKLPEAIRSLSVAVVGASREDMADLKVAVNTISQRAIDFDADESRDAIDGHLEAIDRLRRQRAALHKRLVDVRSAEVAQHDLGAYRGTIAAIATAHQEVEPRFGWLRPLTDRGSRPPVAMAEVVEWLSLLRDDTIRADEEAARDVLGDPRALVAPAEFAAAVAEEQDADAGLRTHAAQLGHPAFGAVRALPPEERARLQQDLHRLADTADELAGRREAWMSEAIADVVSGRGRIWQERAAQLQQLIGQAHPHVQRLGYTDVTAPETELAALISVAQHLHQHLANGAKIKVAPDGTPQVSMLAAKPVKAAKDLFARVRVDGRPPATTDAAERFLAWTEANRLLTNLDRAWPATVAIPAEDTPQERLTWHATELAVLQRVLGLGAALAEQDQRLAQLRLPRTQWGDLHAVRAYAALADSAAAQDRLAVARSRVDATAAGVAPLLHDPAASPTLGVLAGAVADRDVTAYTQAVRRLIRLEEVGAAIGRRDELGTRLRLVTPRLHDAVSGDPSDPAWDRRFAGWDGAWAWTAADDWLADRQVADLNLLQAEVTETENAIRRHVEELAAERAWRHAASPDRISGSARANLQQYGQLVRRLGKGTGKYAVQRRAEIRQAMDRCRSSVPVWIMPIYRIAEQLQVEPNMFDVVVVDEASQASLAATFLQYLAPKIVVIGDDKQVSPSAVGVDQQHLRNLAAQYLHDDPYRASWLDPTRSLFDEAKMRFSGLIPLVEHRRCVPEIINFSNRIAYEPENIRLIPVRQYGADRLEPIKPVLVEDGYVRGTTYKTNPPEAEAIADQIEACIADPRYDGLTFGVISLQGTHQAKLIERLLLQRLDPAEWERRELRCGDSADFQGSERDVTFLSMVAAAEPGVRLGSATADMYVQRYNVAASRAKDQMWVFHSIRVSDVSNPADMRHQLLDYCYGVAARPETYGGTVVPTAVPENERVEPFDSLFEQRVFNRLTGRGHTVVPQYPALGYSIDLVVVGPHSRLAVECDGDTWHGPDRYEADMARQRELERCGWQFFRIAQSAFTVDESSVLQDLWAALERRGIRPSDWSEAGDVVHEAETPASAEPLLPTEAPTMIPPVTAPVPFVREAQQFEAAITTEAGLKPYEVYHGSTPRPTEPASADMREALVAIVEAEGPVLGTRLQTAYVRASGGQRVTRLSASAVNKIISSAVRRGLLVEDNPLGESGIQPKTYRLPHQPDTLTRELGPRTLDEVPPTELALVMARHAETLGWHDEPAVYRATLQTYGRKALTEVAAARLAKVAPLARTIT
ncbi:AAA domain-containing protein [Actinoplanes sp. NPDC049596]|uniref:AAA domain-containing protein n=1 Tax=unclassified Actinoplanes TaxID=2626549 RepID=UPI003438FB88